MKLDFFRLSAAALAVLTNTANAQYFKTVEEAHNPGEERRSFDLVMKPYPIPAKTTTYVDFFFNIPDDAPELFHVTWGEVINSQPDHLHHFVLTGCPETIPEDMDGEAAGFDMLSADCTFAVGQWAPGADIFSNTDLDTGFLLGRGMGIKALQLNVHYTDGVYANETTKELKIAEDGIRVHYTPQFRPYSTIEKKLINVGTAPRQLAVPPGESRFFVSRECEVQSGCTDAQGDTLQLVAGFLGISATDLGLDEISCATLAMFCGFEGEEGSYVKRLCPQTCGYCDGDANPYNPESYRMTAIQHHAHLLGREMYTTLIHGGDNPDEPDLKDLQSRDFWIFDNQETIPFEYDVEEKDTIMRGSLIKPGDKLHSTCVFDSSYREEDTQFYLSTYDEMCIITSYITFPTPANLGDDNADDDIAVWLDFMTFSCVDDERSDVYAGVLGAEEDGRDIWKDHPLSKAEGCTFVTSDFFFGVLTEEMHNCEIEEREGFSICPGDALLLSDAEAGASCEGGTLDGQDANSPGVDREACESGGGTYTPYSCRDMQNYLNYMGSSAGADELEDSGLDEISRNFVIEQWYGPRCCGDAVAAPETLAPEEVVEDNEEVVEDIVTESEDEKEVALSEDEAEASSASGRAYSVVSAVVFLLAAVALG